MLDEPTNHLDINTKEMLLNALEEYRGTVICVSHDTHFIKQLSRRIIYISEKSMELFEGDYEYFSWKLEQKEAYESPDERSTPEPAEQREEKTPQVTLDRKEYNRMKNRLQNLIRQQEQLLLDIDTKEEEIEKVSADMALEKNYSDALIITGLVAKKDALEKEREDLEMQWLSLAEEIESLEEALQ